MKMNLYIWDKFYPDYSDGLAMAIAPSFEQAVELVRKTGFGNKNTNDAYDPERWGEHRILPVDQSVAVAVLGA